MLPKRTTSLQPYIRAMTTTAKQPVKYITDLHFEHRVWLNTLAFRKEEIAIFEHRMEELVKRNTDKEMLAELEHFQNQYIREKEVIDELRHDIKQHENVLENSVKANPVAVDHRHFEDHPELRDRMETFERLNNELRTDFYRWAAKWM